MWAASQSPAYCRTLQRARVARGISAVAGLLGWVTMGYLSSALFAAHGASAEVVNKLVHRKIDISTQFARVSNRCTVSCSSVFLIRKGCPLVCDPRIYGRSSFSAVGIASCSQVFDLGCVHGQELSHRFLQLPIMCSAPSANHVVMNEGAVIFVVRRIDLRGKLSLRQSMPSGAPKPAFAATV